MIIRILDENDQLAAIFTLENFYYRDVVHNRKLTRDEIFHDQTREYLIARGLKQ